MEHVRFCGSDRRAEHLGHLLVREFLVGAQDQRRALLLWQARHRGAHLRRPLVAQQAIGRRFGTCVDVLHFVDRYPGLTIAELLDILRITKQSLNRVLKDLIEQGYIAQKTGTNDRRQRLLFCTAAGADLAFSGHLRDDAEAVAALLDDVPGEPDLVLTTGGVSMGAYDTVKEVLSSHGGVEFVKVAMRPGMPQGSGVLGARRTPVVTLPGNPVSSFVSFHVFVLPVLRALAGLDPEVALLGGVAAQGWSSVAGKVEFTRVVLDDDGVRPSGGQGSHMLGALAEATHLAVVDAGTTEIRPGDPVHLLPLVGQD